MRNMVAEILAEHQMQRLDSLNEFEIKLVCQFCLPQKVICENMGINIAALRMRTARLLEKMGVENQRAAIVKGLQAGLFKLEDFNYREYDGR